MFTKKVALGRLAPIWAEFPKDHIPGFTSIFLVLSLEWNMALAEELENLNARLLMFLNNLKEIEIEIVQDSITSRKTISTNTDEMETSDLRLLYLQPDQFSPYIVFRYQVTSIPRHRDEQVGRRPDILLAFPSNISYPMTDQNSLPQESQQVYAYLPICDYGFRVSPCQRIKIQHDGN
jgi:hypothetical protein